MKKEILKEINSDPHLAMDAIETIYHNRTYVVYKNYSNKKVETFYKTKRGAEGYIEKEKGFSWYDDYTHEMRNAGNGLEYIEIQADEIIDPATNKKIWYDYIKKYWYIDFRFENIMREAEQIVIDNELLEWIKAIVKDIEINNHFSHIEEFEEREPKQVAQIEEIEPVEEMAEEKEFAAANPEPETKAKTNTAVKISFNEDKNGIEIKFDDKPDRAVLENLKANGFRWSRYQKIWYAKDNDERREFIKQFEGAEIGEAGPKVFEYPEININDLDSYRVDPELSRRENDSSWIFRSKERNHNEEIKTILEGYQAQAIEILNLTDDEETIYYVKRDLQRFKKAYHTNYIARLTNKANNPSWAVTGRSGRNANKDRKSIDRYNNLMQESIELVENFERDLYRYRGRIRKVAKKNQQQEIENTNIEIDFKVETKEINYLNAKQKVRTYNYKNYMIAKLWGCFRIFKDGKELSTRIVDLRTTDTLKTAKKAVQRLVNEENEELQKVI